MNITTKVNLSSLTHGIKKMKKQNGEFTECLIIPIAENNLFKGTRGVYLELVAWPYKEIAEGKDTHYLKQSLSKELRDAMTEEEKKDQKFFGSLKVWNDAVSKADPAFSQGTFEEEGPEDDMPF